MKNLKTILVVALLAATATISAQTTSFGIKGGVNASNFSGDNLNDKNAKAGFHIGLFGDFELTPNVAIQSGLLFTTKGAEYKYSLGSIANVTTKMNPMYLQIPVHVAYKVEVVPDTKIVFHAGPYAAYGIAGKVKLSGNLAGYTGETDYNIFEDIKSGEGQGNGLKRFDAGLGLGVGAELGRIVLDLGWDMGLVNISQSDNNKIKNQTGYLSVGYKF